MSRSAGYMVVVDKNVIMSDSTYDRYHCGLTEKYTIHMVQGGQSSYVIGKRALVLSPGNFMFLNCNTRYCHEISSDTKVNTFSVLFDAGFIRDFENSGRKSSSELLVLPECAENGDPLFVESIYPLTGNINLELLRLKNFTDQGKTDQLLLSECLHACLHNYYDLYRSEVLNRADSLPFLSKNTRSEILRRLSVAKDYIISNYNRRISLDDIACAACLSVNHLLRTFKQAYHQSPHQFLTAFRLRQARYYLKNTSYPVYEIVNMVGFECPSSFVRLFRNSFDVTPGQYRKDLIE